MFRNTQKIKDLEKQVEDLKYLCTQLTNNIIRLMQEQAVVTETVKSLLGNQKVINKLISTRYSIKAANDDDIIH